MLLERAYSGGYRILLTAATDAHVEQLNQLLWTYDPDSFLPHGSSNEENQQEQPVLLSTGIEALNSANLLMVTDGRAIENPAFERVIDIFDGNDPQATELARARWKTYKDSGYEMTYFSQNAQGGWQKKQ